MWDSIQAWSDIPGDSIQPRALQPQDVPTTSLEAPPRSCRVLKGASDTTPGRKIPFPPSEDAQALEDRPSVALEDRSSLSVCGFCVSARLKTLLSNAETQQESLGAAGKGQRGAGKVHSHPSRKDLLHLQNTWKREFQREEAAGQGNHPGMGRSAFPVTCSRSLLIPGLINPHIN